MAIMIDAFAGTNEEFKKHIKRRQYIMGICLDRFAQGLPDTQEADYTECPKCGAEIYEGEEYCKNCVEKKLARAIRAIDEVCDRYNVELKAKGPNIVIRDVETFEETYF